MHARSDKHFHAVGEVPRDAGAPGASVDHDQYRRTRLRGRIDIELLDRRRPYANRRGGSPRGRRTAALSTRRALSCAMFGA
jgi:hypothetical protein